MDFYIQHKSATTMPTFVNVFCFWMWYIISTSAKTTNLRIVGSKISGETNQKALKNKVKQWNKNVPGSSKTCWMDDKGCPYTIPSIPTEPLGRCWSLLRFGGDFPESQHPDDPTTNPPNRGILSLRHGWLCFGVGHWDVSRLPTGRQQHGMPRQNGWENEWRKNDLNMGIPSNKQLLNVHLLYIINYTVNNINNSLFFLWTVSVLF